ncbi:ferredoxin [Mycobacterium sp. Aquia_216]|uniref:ferredoxin n=1 Tax=Mycobacterium sp. Aquia_216 TaxID=2991729 RepID=UPI00227CBC79|nr:ferredoxin [Mycobacterium sp. Aquia_216]WAJ43481.1 ferredoxin [Mycobacterium sp. Aquia_216]
MKVIVDTGRCELHGECTIAAPDVFTIEDDKDWVTVLDAQPGEDRRSAVEEAAMMCPVSAIRIED